VRPTFTLKPMCACSWRWPLLQPAAAPSLVSWRPGALVTGAREQPDFALRTGRGVAAFRLATRATATASSPTASTACPLLIFVRQSVRQIEPLLVAVEVAHVQRQWHPRGERTGGVGVATLMAMRRSPMVIHTRDSLGSMGAASAPARAPAAATTGTAAAGVPPAWLLPRVIRAQSAAAAPGRHTRECRPRRGRQTTRVCHVDMARSARIVRNTRGAPASSTAALKANVLR
jgi:hypothetical protein